jgi:hypothetical protein
MNGIPNLGSQNFDAGTVKNQGAAPQKEEQSQASQPGDSVTISENKSVFKKIGEAIIDLPVKALELTLSTTIGTAYAAKNAIPGALEGLKEGVSDYKGHGHTSTFTLATLGEFAAGGAAAGFCMGGPVTAGIGAGIGLLSGLLIRGLESLTEADHKLVESVQSQVDKAVADNTEGTPMQIATRSATEGMVEGGITGVTTGWKLGAALGKGLASGLRGAADGAKEAFFGK